MNNQRLKQFLPLIVLVILAGTIVLFYYGKILQHPNDYMFSTSADGIKNYFTYAYHIKYGESYTNFSGMNFPYGENFLYTDSHPFFAATFKFLAKYFPSISSNSVGIINFIMVFAIFLTSIVQYFLLQKLKISEWVSVLFSISITLLSPQLIRMEGHLALSYSLAIPLSWLLLLKGFENKKWLLAFGLNNVFWLFIHAYLGIIVISFLIAYWFVESTLFFKKTTWQRKIFRILPIILPIIFFYFFAKLTDIHEGRTPNPTGFFDYNANIDDIIISHTSPLRPIIDELLKNKYEIHQNWEAWAYIGIYSVLTVFFTFILFISSIFLKKLRKVTQHFFESKSLNIALISAFVVFLFALAIPFRQFPNLLELLPVFKQFRATGRFTWISYFVLTTYAAFITDKLFLKLLKLGGVYGIFMLLVVFFINIWEALPYHEVTSEKVMAQTNLFNLKFVSHDYKGAFKISKTKDYQAIITLPLFYYGSESFAHPGNNDILQKSIVLSYHTGLPLVNANLTRISIPESRNIIQLVSPNYYFKPIKNDFSNHKPFIIFKHNSMALSPYEEIIYKKGKSLFKVDEFELLEISFDKLFSDDRNGALHEFKKQAKSLSQKSGFLISDSTSFLYYDNFDKLKSDTTYRGLGSFNSLKKGKQIYAEFSPNTFETEKEYHISMWMFNGEQDALNLWFPLIIEEHDEKNDKWYKTEFLADMAETIDGNWSLVEGVFKITNPQSKITIFTEGNPNSKANLHTDDLLIKEKGVEVYKINSPDSTILFYNNHKILLK